MDKWGIIVDKSKVGDGDWKRSGFGSIVGTMGRKRQKWERKGQILSQCGKGSRLKTVEK